MLKFTKKGSKLIIIFILTVIVSGSILTYLSINHISNYRELLEKKISEEERELTKRFSSDFQIKLDSLTLIFTNSIKHNNFHEIIDSIDINAIHGLVDYTLIDSNGVFQIPYYVNEVLIKENTKPSKAFLERLRSAEKNEFITKDFKEAENYYLNCLHAASSTSDSARVYNSMARLYVQMNEYPKAFKSYKTILSKFSDAINSSGFPYAYFSITKLLKIANSSNIEEVQNMILLFLKELTKGTIPLNESTSELLVLIEAWQMEYNNVSNKEIFEKLTQKNKRSLLLIKKYKIPINKIQNENNNGLTNSQSIVYKIVNSVTNDTEELMIFYNHRPNSIGFVIGLKPLFMSVLQNQELEILKFDYNIELVEKNGNNYFINSNLISNSQFSSLFEDHVIRISLKNTNIIDEKVLRRKIIYGIGLFLFLGTMVFGLYLLIQDVNREKLLNKLRADFVSNVTHELKTPLTSINMFAEALNMSKEKLDSRQIKYTNIIVKESEKLKRMINNILEFSRKENDKLLYNLKKSNITEIVHSTLNEMDYFLVINKFKVVASIDENIFAYAYNEGLKQALSNLISNAVKYSTTTKRINIRLFQSSSEIFVEVEDFGIGIDQKEQGHIFEKFYRIKSNEDETTSGTGLGLTVTKAIIEEHHGKLLVESILGQGSKFTIVLNSV